MKDSGRLFWLLTGIILGGGAVILYLAQQRTLQAGTTDHSEDYILCTGSVAVTPRAPSDGIWLLDYRGGRLLGTVINRVAGTIVGWAEVDLVNEFGIAPRQRPHFLMTTGQITYGQAALYVAETTTGKFGIYTMSMRFDGEPGVLIKRHDMISFRPAAPNNP